MVNISDLKENLLTIKIKRGGNFVIIKTIEKDQWYLEDANKQCVMWTSKIDIAMKFISENDGLNAIEIIPMLAVQKDIEVKQCQ